jgi:hypothetical protein
MALSGTGFPTTAIEIHLAGGTVTTGTGSPLNAFCTSAGNGWYRCGFSVAATADSTTAALNLYTSSDGLWANRIHNGSNGSGLYVWGAQVEPFGAVGTYQRTTTKAAFVYFGANRQNLTPWFNAAEGTMAVSFGPYLASGNNLFLAVFNDGSGTQTDAMYTFVGSSNSSSFAVNNNGSVTTVFSQSVTPTTSNKVAAAYKVNDCARSANGAAAETSAPSAIPAATFLRLGATHSNSFPLNSTISRFTYWPARTSNASLPGL